MSSDSKYCFLDANIFIHFQDFADVDWPRKLGSRHVYLVLAPTVLRELNKYKDDNKNEARRRRVRSILPKLEALLEQSTTTAPTMIRSGVSILDIPREPNVNWSALGLDPLVEDDRLVASIIEFNEQHEQAQVLLLSNDFPARRKAGLHGIQACSPKGLIEPKELRSPEDADKRKLEQELRTYRNRIPKLSFSFYEKGTNTQRTIRELKTGKQTWPGDAELEYRLARKRQEFDQIIGAAAKYRVRENDVNEYRRACNEYLKEIRILDIKERARRFARRDEFAFRVDNIGTAPAVDLEIVLVFPHGSFLVGTEDELDDYDGFYDMEPPAEPVAEWLRKQNTYDFLARVHTPFIQPLSPPAREPLPRGPLYDDADRSRVTYTHPKLRHNYCWLLPPLTAYIPPTINGGFGVAYELRADELSGALKEELHVQLQGDV